MARGFGEKGNKLLYRKVNTRARGVQHNHGSDYRKTRGRETVIGMRQGVRRGLDYTPLFRFLLSRVGGRWSEIHSEAVARLGREDPIYWLVAMDYESSAEMVRTGESAWFPGLYVDEGGILRVVNPELDEHSLEPDCKCCTHTFNGVRFTRPFPGP